MPDHPVALLQACLKKLGYHPKKESYVVEVALPTKSQFEAELAKYAPGCGSPTHVASTNGGTMPCGGTLRWPDGSVTREFCPHCKQ